ncbi:MULTISPECIES: putative leader peptide [unclassified Streptacidiphilus]|uniref:Leader peptide n=2 Tax=Streptacidiphilus TaxID=228398 RepID=A0ABV6URI7_9ACTN
MTVPRRPMLTRRRYLDLLRLAGAVCR